jgi:aspartate aminotransferase-like enzyme
MSENNVEFSSDLKLYLKFWQKKEATITTAPFNLNQTMKIFYNLLCI